MNRKKLPIGVQTFKKIRDKSENYVYIDKTREAFSLITGTNVAFLSRPRRFGKSLFLDTIAEIFKGNKALFEGLYIYDKWNWENKFPVIKIDYTGGSLTSIKGIIEAIRYCLDKNCKELGIKIREVNSNNVDTIFNEIISDVKQKYNVPVVVLIDEYDKPILDNIGKEDKTLAKEAREILNAFYSALKASDEFLKFVFLTGVSKFSKLNLFSGLNNIQDITLHNEYQEITGYTHDDVKNSFSEYLEGVDLEEVKMRYNGYNYFGESIYNPFDILLFLSNSCEFKNYWWGTGNPQFLIEKLNETPQYLPDLENSTVGEETLDSFDVENIDLIALLWQTGYLTFDSQRNVANRTRYKMKIPNLEIQLSLNELFFKHLSSIKSITAQNNVVDALLENDMDKFHKILSTLFNSIPYDNYVKNNIERFEGYYSSVMYAFLCSLGFQVKTEDHTSTGRIDMALIDIETVYIFEFKVDAPEEAAIKQIEERKYYEKYINQYKNIYLIGIQFSSEKRNIVGFDWKKI